MTEADKNEVALILAKIAKEIAGTPAKDSNELLRLSALATYQLIRLSGG